VDDVGGNGKPLISVVVPTYNEEKCIGRALHYLSHQTLPRGAYEIIVVDGHSRDRTVEIAEKHADKVIQQVKEGVAGARNDGVEASEADIIATTDADCVVPPDWLERTLKGFDEKGTVCLYGIVKPLENTTTYNFWVGVNNFFVHQMYRLHILYMAVGANTAFRKKEFQSIGGYPIVKAGDDYGLPIKFRRRNYKVTFNGDLYVLFSMRRYQKYGFLNSYYRWLGNVFNEMAKKRIFPVDDYLHQTY